MVKITKKNVKKKQHKEITFKCMCKDDKRKRSFVCEKQNLNLKNSPNVFPLERKANSIVKARFILLIGFKIA